MVIHQLLLYSLKLAFCHFKSTFVTISKSKPYGLDVSITKVLGMFKKRLFTWLHKLKSKNKGVILSDGKPIGGKIQLTDIVIDQQIVNLNFPKLTFFFF